MILRSGSMSIMLLDSTHLRQSHSIQVCRHLEAEPLFFFGSEGELVVS